jgi:hypothetical protein
VKLRESHRLDPALGTLLNIATCEEALGQLASAWQHYEEVTQGLPAGDPRLRLARTRSAMLRKRVPYLTIRRNPRAPSGIRVYREGVVLTTASFDVALPLDPGVHELIVRADGYAEREYRVTLEPAQKHEITVEPGPPLVPSDRQQTAQKPAREKARPRTTGSNAPPGSDARPGAKSSSGLRTFGFALGGVGVAALAVTGITGILVLDRKNTVSAKCPNKICNQEGLDAAESGAMLAAVSSVAFAVGVSALGASAYILLTTAPATNAGAVARFRAPPIDSISIGGRF